MFFGSISDVFRIVVTAIALYFLLVLVLRVSGKRTLSAMNAFDLIVTVALGTTLASTILDSSITLTDGLTALIVLIGLQFSISWLSSRSKTFSHWVKSEPKLLCYRGELLKDSMKQERIVQTEVLQALRSKGYSSLQEAEAVILETNGSISIISKIDHSEKSSIKDVNTSHS